MSTRLDPKDLYTTTYQQGEDNPRSLHDSWHRGDGATFLPSKGNLGEQDALRKYVMHGWMPPKPVIKADAKVLAVGSCSAQHIAAHLRRARKSLCVNQGHEIGKTSEVEDGRVNLFTFGAGFVNTFTIRQQFEWALGEREIGEGTLYVESIPRGSEGFRRLRPMPVDEKSREASKSAIEEAEAIIITVGGSPRSGVTN